VVIGWSAREASSFWLTLISQCEYTIRLSKIDFLLGLGLPGSFAGLNFLYTLSKTCFQVQGDSQESPWFLYLALKSIKTVWTGKDTIRAF